MADAVAVDTWSGGGIRLNDVVSAMADLRHQSTDRSPARTAVMTIIAVAPTDEQAYAATNALRLLGGHHPARILILRPDPDQVSCLNARASLYEVRDDNHQINFEEVILSVCGQAALHLDSVVEAFTLSDLPVAVWYVSSLPDATDPLLSVATAVLLDSRDAADAGELRSLLGLARRRTVVDLSWIRLAPWRELLCGLFEPASARPWIEGVERVEVRGKGGPRQLLGGWLVGQLRLSPDQITLTDSRHVEIRLESRLGDQVATFIVERGDHREVAAQAKLPSGLSPRQFIALSDDPLPTSLSLALTHLEPDPTWERALSFATSLAL
jgi:glucose-6-phosphate dehydrogenase assembly protein OpcA